MPHIFEDNSKGLTVHFKNSSLTEFFLLFGDSDGPFSGNKLEDD